ncbi:hypothetical protein NP233_g4085 [Leucocoprinus birnbaumii]|uniref:NAD(P)-binding protein n=1 Tax=Leucocoprinus birnbaumii TaxID=56174 RepID=A0AAD5YT98_9AGAR|nr:hypothetical protein NP233_g4085 [Leucocoprinus birnbaumii]
MSLKNIPPVRYTLQNVLISLGTVVSSVSSLALTAGVILPLSIARNFVPVNLLQGPQPRRVILVVGASSGIGYEVTKIYAAQPETTIIAASSKPAKVKEAVTSLGKTQATIVTTKLDLKSGPQKISDKVKELEADHGPITHLYAVSGISNHLDSAKPWGLEVTNEMIDVNIKGTVATVITLYDLMKERGFGKICIVGSVAGYSAPANMISYASTKAFINTFATSLRAIASHEQNGVNVVCVAPGFIKTRMTDRMRSQGSTMPGFEFANAEGMAQAMVDGVEQDGVGLVSWPLRQSVLMYALQGLNPLCDTLGRLLTFKAKVSGKKIT